MAYSSYPKAPTYPVATVFQSKPVAPDTFELALALGGTVSAGAYTAGVLDFLVEALDEWEKAKQDEDRAPSPGVTVKNVPRHRVLLRAVSGSSGGGINGILTAKALNYVVPHPSLAIPAAAKDAAGRSNVYYQTWVNGIDIQGLLETSDLGPTCQQVPSLLCGNVLERVAREALTFAGAPPPRRDYVTSPLPVILTYTNLSGIPYSQKLQTKSERSEYFIDHADYIRYTVDIGTGKPGGPVPPDAVPIGRQGSGIAWSGMIEYVLGTGAFPFGLPPRQIRRTAEHYRYRYARVEAPAMSNQSAGTASPTPAPKVAGVDILKQEFVWMEPCWEYLVPAGPAEVDNYAYVAIDGGCIDNEPIELARTWMAGVGGRNPRDGASANRGLILIDPFAATPAPRSSRLPGMLGLLFPTLSALLESNRYETADMSLFVDDKVFSRFLVTPIRSAPSGRPGDARRTGGDAIAGAALGAFMGFMCKDFREHDYMLGRRNCQQFLRGSLTLPENNTVFKHAIPPTIRDPARTLASSEIPLIPLFGSAAIEQPEPQWPRGKFSADSLRAPIRRRVRAILPVFERSLVRNCLLRFLLGLFNGFISRFVADKAIAAIQAELDRAKL
jgi:hypothetical protein